MITKKLLLHFPTCETEKPIVYQLVKDYGLMINIFAAKVTQDQEGFLVLDITGTEEDMDRGMDYVRGFGVTIREVDSGIVHDLELCTHCGNCLSHCPTKALHIADRRSMKVEFDKTLCIACMACVANCPYSACTALF
ncbi:MAG: 4Fe-4S binding protein [Oligosphaeraceae bacterium]|nr:4Fe-4S binding protein [Oligosphaeraceae bacterium]